MKKKKSEPPIDRVSVYFEGLKQVREADPESSQWLIRELVASAYYIAKLNYGAEAAAKVMSVIVNEAAIIFHK